METTLVFDIRFFCFVLCIESRKFFDIETMLVFRVGIAQLIG